MSLKDHPCRIEQCRTYQLDNPEGWTIQGHSKAGERTGFFLKTGGKRKIYLDAGMSTYRQVDVVCMTHMHTDHSAHLPSLITTRSKPRPVLMPESAVPRVCMLERAIIGLSRAKEDPLKLTEEEVWKRQNVRPIPVNAGDTIILPELKDMVIEILPAYHDAQSVGYGFSTVKRKLLPEYQELTKTKEGRQQIGQLRKSGTQVTEECTVPQLAFFCDSTHHNLTTEDSWKKYPVVICECTGFPVIHSPETMTQRAHSHLDHILPVMLKEKTIKQWILIHTSMTLCGDDIHAQEAELREKWGLNVTIVCDVDTEAALREKFCQAFSVFKDKMEEECLDRLVETAVKAAMT